MARTRPAGPADWAAAPARTRAAEPADDVCGGQHPDSPDRGQPWTRGARWEAPPTPAAGLPEEDPHGPEEPAGPPRPVVWAALDAGAAELEWVRLNDWVEDLREVFNLDATVVPPFWHRHQLLVEHLSALRTHWLAAYDPDQHGSAPFGWIRDLEEWKTRIREAVSQLGCRIDTCRPARQTLWPGQTRPRQDHGEEADYPPAPPVNLADRAGDFASWVVWDTGRRRHIETRYYQLAAGAAGHANHDAGDA
jgi:hypothetical protein